MNVTEFAEQIVFGKTLEDKLLVPGRLTHDGQVKNRPDVSSLIAPSRMAGLEMRHDRGGSVQPPSDDQLEHEWARGQLLHFLANHELLATELMALVLLKFPDAPRAFRQGVLVTLQEEQEHTRMYIKRMKECGVEFGSYPLSGQFWRVVEPMESPMDFVSRLSLTFEQANLDYSLHFASVFDRIGDSETAGLLQKIYEDEIGHVQHGLHWFRQWKDPEQSDWEAYQEQLEFPMSPQRGRGPRASFNRDGRARAGLTTDFIDSIEVFRQSRGRPPTVHWFDAGAESDLPGQGDRSDDLVEQLSNDLELVMVPVSKQDDVVLVRSIPSRELRKHLIDCGFELPEFVKLDSFESLKDRKLGGFLPWAWTPSNHKIADSLSATAKIAPPKWTHETADLFRKSWSVDFLGRWLRETETTPNWFANADCVGIEIHELADIQQALGEIGSRGFSMAVFKLDLGASGRGQRRLATQGLNDSDKAWLESVFNNSAAHESDPSATAGSGAGKPVAILEPHLDRVLDLSFLWRLDTAYDSATNNSATGKSDFLGWTRALVTFGGRRYSGTRLSNPLVDCADEVRRFLLADRSAKLEVIKDWLESRVVKEFQSRSFNGHLGVDVFLYRDSSGDLRIKPVCEINPRMTMGHVGLALQKNVAPGVTAEFRILARSEWDQLSDSIQSAALETSKDGRWVSGVIRLSESNEHSKLVPVVLVGTEYVERFKL